MKRLVFLLALLVSTPAMAGQKSCPLEAAGIDRQIAHAQASLANAISRGNVNKVAVFTAQLASLQLKRAALPC